MPLTGDDAQHFTIHRSKDAGVAEVGVGGLHVIETASVILQVASFKLTGKRIFLMSPIHHHFEMKGWSEWQIDLTFWLVGLIASCVYLVFFL